jgi:circadian clock protein KaiC
MKQDLEEYVSDCVLYLDHRVSEQISTRRLRVVKYRGSSHGGNEYPFLIEDRGISVLPLSSVGLDYEVSTARVPTGIPRLDEMLGGKGYYRSSSILVSGTAGTGKSSTAAHFADATCRRGERCLYFAFEESEKQVIRNMKSIGIDLGAWVAKGLLQIHAARPTVFGLEMHLVSMHRLVEEFAPSAVVIDPISNFIISGTVMDVKAMLVRLVDFLKMKGITGLLTCLTGPATLEDSEAGISSLIDTWIQVRTFESAGERTHGLYVLKSRGMAHSNQVREFVITSKGIELVDIELGPDGVLTGSARLAHAAQEKAATVLRKQQIDHGKQRLERKRSALQAQIELLRAELAAHEEEFEQGLAEERQRERSLHEGRTRMLESRGGRGSGKAPGAARSSQKEQP